MFRLHKNTISLITIILLGLIFRFFHLTENIWNQSGYDESRDMLVAKHIVEFGENISKGPLAAGGLGLLQNSEVYYYFLAFIWNFSRSPQLFMILWVMLHSLAIPLAFFCGKQLKDIKTGLLFSVLVAMSPQFIYSSRELLQPHLLLLFSLIFIWSSFVFVNSNFTKSLYLNVAICFLLLPLHFHYGILLFLPFGFLWIGYLWLQYIYKNNYHYFSWRTMIPPVLVVFLVLTWAFTTYRVILFDQLYFIISNIERVQSIEPLTKITNVINILGNTVFKTSNKYGLTALSLIVFFGIVNYKKIVNQFSPIKLILIVSGASSLLLALFFSGNVAETYILYIFPFWLMLVAIIMRYSFEKSVFFTFVTIVGVLSMMFSGYYSEQKYNLPIISFHEQQQNIAQAIYDDYSILDTNFHIPNLLITYYTTSRNMPYDGWGSSGIWFYLEGYFDKQLIKLIPSGMNHYQIQSKIKYIYMTCDHRIFEDKIQEECIDRFLSAHSYVSPTLIHVASTPSLTTWRAHVNDNYTHPVLYKVHRDLLNL